MVLICDNKILSIGKFHKPVGVENKNYTKFAKQILYNFYFQPTQDYRPG